MEEKGKTSQISSAMPGKFLHGSTVWRSAQYSTNTQVMHTPNTAVWSWMLENYTERHCQPVIFHTISLRKICRIFWPQRITNQKLLNITNQRDILTIIAERCWNWISHILRRREDSIVKVALCWTPEGKRKRGYPKSLGNYHRGRGSTNGKDLEWIAHLGQEPRRLLLCKSNGMKSISK